MYNMSGCCIRYTNTSRTVSGCISDTTRTLMSYILHIYIYIYIIPTRILLSQFKHIYKTKQGIKTLKLYSLVNVSGQVPLSK